MPLPKHVRLDLELINDAAGTAREIAYQHRSDLSAAEAKIQQDPNLSGDGRAAKIRELRAERDSTAKQRLRGAREIVAEAVEAVTTWACEAEAEAAGDSNAQLVAELREQRGWARAQTILDGGGSVDQIMEVAASTGDTAMLSALRRELPAITAANPRSGDVSGQITQGVRRVDAVLTPMLDGPLRDVREAQTAMADRLQQTTTMLNNADGILAGSQSGLGAAIADLYATSRDGTPPDASDTGDASEGDGGDGLGSAA